MFEKVRNTIVKNQLLFKGDRVIVGFSGGIDSTVLLHILCSLVDYNLDIWAVYINHSLRPQETPREEKLLEEVGRQWGIKTQKFTVNIPEYLKQKSESIQLLAREERYKIFQQFRATIKADKIALAHHLDDQVETILYRIIRGTGLDGLAGIPIIRDVVFIRPLLEVTRKEIAEYAASQRLFWLEDSSNKKLIYQRNKIRLQLIPFIEESFNPRFKDSLVRLAKMAAEQRNLMEDLVAERTAEILLLEEKRVGIRIRPFLNQPSYLQYCIIKHVFLKMKPNFQLEILALERLVQKIVAENYQFKRMHVFKGVTVYRENELLFFEESVNPFFAQQESLILNAPGLTSFPALNLQFEVSQDQPPIHWNEVGNHEVYIATQKLSLPLKIRFWQPGDFFWPLGGPGFQKLHDFFINSKIPRMKRRLIPLVVTADNRIIWITGYRLSGEFKIKPGDREVWHIKAEPLNN